MTTLVLQKISKQTDYTATIIHHLDEFKNMEAEWNELLKKTGDSSLCIRHDWIVTWLEHFPASIPCIILVRNTSGLLVSAIPLKISVGSSGIAQRLLRYVQFVGTDPCVYEQMRIPCLIEENFTKIAQQAVLALIKIQQQWDILDLRYFCNKAQLQTLLQALLEAGRTAQITPTMSNPYLILPNKLEDYTLKRKKIIKKNVNNMLNRLKQDFPNQPLNLIFLEPNLKSLEFIEQFFQCHTEYWQQQGFKSDFQKFPALKNFYKFLFFHYQNKDIHDSHTGLKPVQFSILSIGNHPISYEFGFWQGKSYLHHLSSYNTAFKRYSPGMLHLEYLIQDAIRQQGTVFDLGRGEEPYKENWTQDKQELWNLLSVKGEIPKLLWNGDEYLKRVYCQLKSFRKNYIQRVKLRSEDQ